MLGLKTFRTMKKIVTGLVRRGVRDALHRLWGDGTRLSLFFWSQSRGQRGWMHIYHMNTLPAPPRPGREVEERSISSPSPHVLCRAHNADCHVVRTAFLLLLSSLHCMARHCFFFFLFRMMDVSCPIRSRSHLRRLLRHHQQQQHRHHPSERRCMKTQIVAYGFPQPPEGRRRRLSRATRIPSCSVVAADEPTKPSDDDASCRHERHEEEEEEEEELYNEGLTHGGGGMLLPRRQRWRRRRRRRW